MHNTIRSSDPKIVELFSNAPARAPERETPPPAPVNLYDGLKVRQSLFAGICDAIADYLTDPRFMVGFYVGTIGTCAAAWLVVFL